MIKKHSSVRFIRQKNKFDPLLLILPLFFTLFGLLMIYEASNVVAFQSFSDKYHYVKDQSVWAAIGLVLMIVTSKIKYRKYFNLAVPMMLITLICLIAVLIPGIGIKALGARRWLGFGQINFQPSELAKISLILYLSAWLSEREKGRFLAFVFLLSLIVGLVILQPDLGTAVVLTAIFLGVYFISKAPLWHFSLLIPVTIISVFILALISPYRYQRLVTFLDPNRDPLGTSYHIRQVLIALGSGGLTGLGLGSSIQKYQFLPEATTDSIFAIIGEEFGFFGSSVLIILYLIFIYRMYKIVINAPDKFAFLLGSGILCLLAFQILINIGAMVAIFPLTGIPLPFISYGGSSLIVSLTAVGILFNISRYTVSKK